jgi:chromosome segregation ATPase
MLDAWYASLAKRLDANNGEFGSNEQGTLPAPVLRAAKALWGRAQQYAHEQASQSIQDDRDALNKQVEQLTADRLTLKHEQERLNERSEALGLSLQAKDHQIAALERQLTDLQAGVSRRDAELKSLSTQQAEASQALQVERSRLNAVNEEHRQERERLEQRAAAQERRLLEEVDRVRQELKRVTQLHAGESKKSAAELAASREDALSLRFQIGVLRTENEGLSRELLAAREDMHAAHLKQEQVRKETMDLLADLKVSLPKNVNAEKFPSGRAPAARQKPPRARPASKR